MAEQGVLLGDLRQRLLVGNHLAAGFADGDAIAVRGAHHDAFEDGLAADQRFFDAGERGQQLKVREQTEMFPNRQAGNWLLMVSIAAGSR